MIYSEYLQCPRPVKATMTLLPPTPSDIEGPFYKEGAPFRSCIVPDGTQPTLHLTGRVMNENGDYIEAVLDFWQANEKGEYDNEGFNYRGKVKTISYAPFRLDTVRPGDYQIADNPPDFRCAHIHIKVSAPGYKSLTTQLYFADDKYDATDHWFDARRIIGDPFGTFNFVLEKETP